jgi:putative copper resistance protein D
MELIVVVRSIHIAASVLVAGAFAFEFLVWPRTHESQALQLAVSRWLGLCAGWAIGVALLTWTIWLALIASNMSGASPTVEVFRTVLAQTNFGHVWTTRFLLGLLLAMGLLRRRSGHAKVASRAMGGMTAALFLVSLAWAGHAMGATADLHNLRVGVDAFHLLGAGLWLGALLPLCLVLRRARTDTGQAWLLPAAAAVRNFSVLGIVAVLTILVTGVANTVFQVGSIEALVESGYGQLVCAKIALFLAIIAIAVYNRLRLVPRMEASETQAAAGQLTRLYRNAMLELLLGGAIIAVVGLLGNMAPSTHFHGPDMQHMPSADHAHSPAA